MGSCMRCGPRFGLQEEFLDSWLYLLRCGDDYGFNGGAGCAFGTRQNPGLEPAVLTLGYLGFDGF